MRRLGVLGTRYLMEGPVYRDVCADAKLEVRVPDPETREGIHRIIFDELVWGRVTDSSSVTFFQAAIAELEAAGCDGVVLGCTEIPLIVTPERSVLPTLDSTRLLARAALSWASDAEMGELGVRG